MCAIEVDVMPMGSRDIGIQFMPQIPFVSEPMGWIEMSVDRLVHHLVPARDIAIQRHQRVARAKHTRGGHLAVASHEQMIRRRADNFASVQSHFDEGIAPDESRRLEQ